MNRFLPAVGRRSLRSPRRTRLRIESLTDRITPTVIVNGTLRKDVITTRLLPEGSSDPTSVEILVNGVAKAQIGITGSWPFPTTSYFLADGLVINGRRGSDRIELGLIRPASGDYITVTGGKGNDTIVGGYGHDSLIGGPGADDLFGGVDEDTIVADPADVRLVGGGGVDWLDMSGIRGTATVTPTSLTINGRTLSEADGTFSGFMITHLAGTGGNDHLTVNGMFRVRLTGNDGNDRLETDADSEAMLSGGYGRDTLVGGTGNDSIFGGPGADVLFGGDDQFPDFTNNQMEGGSGNDIVTGGTGFNTLIGDAGNDRLIGGPRLDSMFGEEGNDTLVGGDGNDQMYGDIPASGVPFTYIGADSLVGEAGPDVIYADRADTRIDGGVDGATLRLNRVRGRMVLTDTSLTINGRPIPVSGIGPVWVTGEGTADVLDASGFSGFVGLSGGAGNDTLKAGAGDSTLDGDAGADDLEGGAGSDALTADTSDTRLVGGAGGFNQLFLDGISGTAVLTDSALTINGRPVASGELDFVTLIGTDTDDLLDASGFSGAVGLEGRAGDDTLKAGAGGSTLFGDVGADDLEGGAGDDQLTADASDTRLLGGGGTDNVSVSGISGMAILTDSLLTINGVEIDIGGFELFGMSGSDMDDTLNASAFSGQTALTGGGGNDILAAGAGDSNLQGDAGDDTLQGGAGVDFVYGGADDDYLEGRGGSDTLLGFAGADIFVPDFDATVAAEEQARSDYNPAEGDTGY